MASVLHGSARTTPRVRAELQTAQTPSRAIALQVRYQPQNCPEVGPAEHDRRSGDGPKAETAETRKRFKADEIGYVHIDS